MAIHSGVGWDNKVPANIKVNADPDHLHRIISNLVRNAAEAMAPQAEGGSRIIASLSPQGLDLADTGPGLPDSARENLFKPFAGSSRSSGTGLGLVIARELAQGMGGDLVLASTGPEGTVFRLSLPGLGA